MKKTIDAKEIPAVEGARVEIIQSSWYREFSDKIVKKSKELLEKAGCAEVRSHLIPGSVELPLAAKILCEQPASPDAIIAVGVILKGETHHFEMVANECARGLMDVMIQEGVPIVNEVLAVNSLNQVKERAGDDEFNKGIEAAFAAAKMIAFRREITGSSSAPVAPPTR